MTHPDTPSPTMSNEAHGTASLASFVSKVAGDDVLRIEEDFGGGFVRLKISEAERRQAAQDIRSSEDILIELLRNSRDAGASNIFVALQRDGDRRTIDVIDDGSGVPDTVREAIFLPRVTSKLDSAHLDNWGVHGRGMALFSIRENAESSKIVRSAPGLGCAIKVVTDITSIGEKTDQSTFPRFEVAEGIHVMRGPKNLVRTAAEFAFAHRDQLHVFCGSPTEIVSAMYQRARRELPSAARVFGRSEEEHDVTLVIGLEDEPNSLASVASSLGLDISERTARRVIEKDVMPAKDMMERLRLEAFGEPQNTPDNLDEPKAMHRAPSTASSAIRISKTDIDSFAKRVKADFDSLANDYYLTSSMPIVTQRGGRLTLTIDLIPKE